MSGSGMMFAGSDGGTSMPIDDSGTGGGGGSIATVDGGIVWRGRGSSRSSSVNDDTTSAGSEFIRA
jgi:hypothetical protein